MSEETWVLMSIDVFNAARRIGTIKLWNEALHARADEMEADPHIHRHLNEGGIVVIHVRWSERLRDLPGRRSARSMRRVVLHGPSRRWIHRGCHADRQTAMLDEMDVEAMARDFTHDVFE